MNATFTQTFMLAIQLLFAEFDEATAASVAQELVWRAFAAATYPCHTWLRISSPMQLDDVAPGSVDVAFAIQASAGFSTGLARVIGPDGLVVVSCRSSEATSESVTRQLHSAGMQTVAAMQRVVDNDIWCIATKATLTQEAMRQRANSVLAAEAEIRSRRADTVDIEALARTLRGGDASGVAQLTGAMLSRFPLDARIWELHGVARLYAGNAGDALIALQRASTLLPHGASIWENQGLALNRLARFFDANVCFERSMAIDATRLSVVLAAAQNAIQSANFARAEILARRVLSGLPDDGPARLVLGNALFGQEKIEQAIVCFSELLQRHPDTRLVRFNLSVALRRQGRTSEAILLLEEETRRVPEYAAAHSLLGRSFLKQGRLGDAATSLRRAIAIKPDDHHAQQCLLYCLTHDHDMPVQVTFDAHRRWGELAEATAHTPQAHSNLRDPGRRLRVGFVSADLRAHAVSYFLAPVWAALDPKQVEIWAYSNAPHEDLVSDQLRGLSHTWRAVHQLDDAALAACIRNDQIDILFDLSGHTVGNRLLAFALKPAPVQVTWIGYPNTTGLATMDYVLCDRFNAPHGLYEHLYTEKFARLPSSGTFSARAESPLPNRLPALAKGYVTFASFNRMNKLGETVVAAWCRVLREIEGSRMVLGNVGDEALRERLTAMFARHGIAAARLSFHPKVPLQDYLLLHHEVDMMLDTWPYTGGTTTNFAIWMGVPVVTLAGPTRVHCQSAAVLGRLGMADWIAQDVDQFVRLAVTWANAPDALSAVRAGMRERWATAPLRQPSTVAMGLQLAVRAMWERWCNGLAPAHLEVDHHALRQAPT